MTDPRDPSDLSDLRVQRELQAKIGYEILKNLDIKYDSFGLPHYYLPSKESITNLLTSFAFPIDKIDSVYSFLAVKFSFYEIPLANIITLRACPAKIFEPDFFYFE
jgi:hypothetical protein